MPFHQTIRLAELAGENIAEVATRLALRALGKQTVAILAGVLAITSTWPGNADARPVLDGGNRANVYYVK